MDAQPGTTASGEEPRRPAGEGLTLSQTNPQRLSFRGRPCILVTSGEHYGALINLDFDYRQYLDWLAKNKLNLTRVFSGAYVEGERSLSFAGFGRNTLAPRPGRFLAPWARRGGRFDLDAWEARYFERLRDLVSLASKREIVIELTLFSTMYRPYNWNLSPLCQINNVNNVGRVNHADFTTLTEKALVHRQEALVHKIAAELADFDNVYFETCNEPEDHRPEVRHWLEHLNKTLRAADSGHLIASSVMRSPPTDSDHPIINFHYTWNESAIGAIEALDMVSPASAALAFNETLGPLFHQTPDQVRVEAWEFLVGGGSIYNGLSWEYTTSAPAGAGRGHRAACRQLSAMRAFLERLNLLAMRVDRSCIVDISPSQTRLRALRNGQEILIYLHQGKRAGNAQDTVYVFDGRPVLVEVTLELPAGRYRAFWIDPRNTAVVSRQDVRHHGGCWRLTSPAHSIDMLLHVRRSGDQHGRGV